MLIRNSGYIKSLQTKVRAKDDSDSSHNRSPIEKSIQTGAWVAKVVVKTIVPSFGMIGCSRTWQTY
uniref:Uncharacterized protein n=1 Tax=Romanomermis culicivorax TaxID=13658 RepID=A0A915IRI5_ROMCU